MILGFDNPTIYQSQVMNKNNSLHIQNEAQELGFTYNDKYIYIYIVKYEMTRIPSRLTNIDNIC